MLFRLNFWSYVSVTCWPLLLVVGNCPSLTARYIQLTELWWLLDWLFGTAQFAGPMSASVRRLPANAARVSFPVAHADRTAGQGIFQRTRRGVQP